MAKWVNAMQSDPRHTPAKRLDEVELRDHFEEILDYLKATLLKAFDPEIKQGMRATASAHGRTRRQQGYDLDQLLSEFSHLRSEIIVVLAEFFELNPEVGGAARIYASTTIHRYFDDAMRASVAEYLRALGCG